MATSPLAVSGLVITGALHGVGVGLGTGVGVGVGV
jgi:hypothetical protein